MTTPPELDRIYPLCRSNLGPERWRALADRLDATGVDQPAQIAHHASVQGLSAFIGDLARLERTTFDLASRTVPRPQAGDGWTVNPAVALLDTSWKLSAFVQARPERRPQAPEPGPERVLMWKNRPNGEIRIRAARDADLLALKVVAEGLSTADAARTAQVSVGTVVACLAEAQRAGFVLRPGSQLQRPWVGQAAGSAIEADLGTAQTFTLQWHITHACELRCAHCYDRRSISALRLPQARSVLADLREFCDDRHVRGHVCLTGGNPLLHPDFLELYRATAEHGFTISLLANPTSAARIQELVAIQPPTYYQLSLEGLDAHNDAVRGVGHFDAVIQCLADLRRAGVRSAIMLTLTSENIGQVLPLAERMRGLADRFTFNRLSQVGEGANLMSPSAEDYQTFLAAYVEAARENEMLSFKDNLLNVTLERKQLPMFDGCTGFGCGAAFNFMALLPDGEIHACRKFPSPIGNVLTSGLGSVYDSEPARRYRTGCTECHPCRLRARCGGCLAVSHGRGLDELAQRDPDCFAVGVN